MQRADAEVAIITATKTVKLNVSLLPHMRFKSGGESKKRLLTDGTCECFKERLFSRRTSVALFERVNRCFVTKLLETEGHEIVLHYGIV